MEAEGADEATRLRVDELLERLLADDVDEKEEVRIVDRIHKLVPTLWPHEQTQNLIYTLVSSWARDELRRHGL